MNESVIFKEYELTKLLMHKIDYIIDRCIRDCHHKNFHTFDHIWEYEIQLTNITNNEIVFTSIFDKNMSLYELIEKITVARGNGFIFNQ